MSIGFSDCPGEKTSPPRWTAVADLRIGDQLATTSGAPARVAAIRKYSDSRHMLNLTVATVHTYYVLAGHTPVLVHNAGCGGLSSGASVEANQGAIDSLSAGDGLSGIYDPTTGRFEARLSGEGYGKGVTG